MGAMLGTAYGTGLHHLMPGIVGPAGAYGLVGMGAVFAGAARAPITAVIIIFELTGDYRIILPLMFAIALAAGISSLISHDTIYTLKLRRRGIDIMRGRGANLMQLLTVADAMQPLPSSLSAATPLNEVIARLADGAVDSLPVVDDEGTYVGAVSSQQIDQAMRDNALDACAGDLAQEMPPLTGRQTLEEALGALLRARSGLPVVARGRHASRSAGSPTSTSCARTTPPPAGDRAGAAAGPAAPVLRPRESRRLSNALMWLRGYRIVDLELATKQAPVGQPPRRRRLAGPVDRARDPPRRPGLRARPATRCSSRATG